MTEKDPKNKTVNKPAAKPAAPAKPAATAKPAAPAKPAATAKPTTPAKPAATAKPAAPAKPAATAKPATSAKPAATAKPAAPVKPAATAKPAAPAKPAATAKPAYPAPHATSAKPADAAPKSAATKPVTEKSAAAKSAAPSKPEVAAVTKTSKNAKSEKKTDEKPAKSSGGKGAVAAALKNNKVRAILIAAVAFILVLAILIGIIAGTQSCNDVSGPKFTTSGPPSVLSSETVGNDNPTTATATSKPIVAPPETVENDVYENEYSATSEVGFSAEVKNDYERKLSVATKQGSSEPYTNDGEAFGNTAYPKYGYTLSDVVGAGDEKSAARQRLINESDYYCALGTWNNSGNGNNKFDDEHDGTYTWMDENGYLWNGTRANPVRAVNLDGSYRQLFKHDAAAGMYFGGYGNTTDLLDSEPGIVKEVTIRPRKYSSYSVTGVYAPAGEIIKIEISEQDMNATGGITIHIGQALYNGQSNNIWAAKGQMQRFPNILNTMNVNKNTAVLENGVYTAYVGSFVGGPIYIRNTTAEFTATISGGVAYSHFILGYTTKEEFEKNKESSAPYFDLEVWNFGVLHSGPKIYAQNYTYDDLYKVAVLWEKVASVTTTGSSQGIVFLYDAFVAAGAAVAFPGRSSVNCPAGWMSGSLNYNGIVSSGSWGNFHEYHHNFQSYGVGAGGEVTNNGMTLVSYALFTKISSKRGIASYGGQGLGGWNNYTSATWALNDLLSIQRGGSPSNGKQGLAIYATLLHNFGANNYIQAKFTQQSKSYGENYSGYMRAWQDITHNNMSYFFKDVLKGLDNATAKKFSNSEYPMFVPVSSVYQTGRSYMYDGEKRYFQTMQPYVIPYGADFSIDLSKYSAPGGQYASGSVVIPDDLDYRIKSVTQPAHGTIEVVDNFHLKYKPSSEKLSGQIIVTLEIIHKKGSFKVDDVDLVLEFEQSHETNKMTLERTTYSYSPENMYTDAVTAYENGFKNYTDKVEKANHTNPVQNCNTDIWFYPDTEQNRKDHSSSPESHFVHPNTIEVLDGKLYFEEEGKYNIYLRGRENCAVYYSLDGGKTYQFGAKVTNGSGANFYVNNPETYFTVELDGHAWVYVKEVLIVQSSPMISYIGLGYGKWTTPMFTIVEKYYKADGKTEVDSPEAEEYDHTVTHYYDYRGNEVTAEEASSADLVAPTGATYVNAYRCNYEFPDNTDFETDYFYMRSYPYTYSKSYNNLTEQAFVGDHGCFFDEERTDFRPEYLFDGDLTTQCSSANVVSADNPWVFTVDLGKTIEANRFVLTGYKYGGNSNKNQTPNSITLSVGETLEDMKEVANFDNGKVDNVTLAFNFETSTFRYYRFTARRTVEGRFGAIANIEFSNSSDGVKISPDNKAFSFAGNWKTVQATSSFGHVYAGEAGATLSFKFNGKKLALFSNHGLGENFEVTIDGKKTASSEFAADDGAYGISYLSSPLEDKEHTVVIKCLGKANIDSVIVLN